MAERGRTLLGCGLMASSYQRLSIAEKQALDHSRVREPSVACPSCGTQVMPQDLLAHVGRCGGRRDPGPRALWVSWRDALRTGVPPMTLSFWARRGDVRVQGGRGDRKYLLRDLTLRLAQRQTLRRR